LKDALGKNYLTPNEQELWGYIDQLDQPLHTQGQQAALRRDVGGAEGKNSEILTLG
jgi:hypothetical protein